MSGHVPRARPAAGYQSLAAWGPKPGRRKRLALTHERRHVRAQCSQAIGIPVSVCGLLHVECAFKPSGAAFGSRVKRACKGALHVERFDRLKN
eukprot:3710880-Alexandrium_andersonii.AAC.1